MKVRTDSISPPANNSATNRPRSSACQGEPQSSANGVAQAAMSPDQKASAVSTAA